MLTKSQTVFEISLTNKNLICFLLFFLVVENTMPSSQHVGKIASAAVKNREQTPLISWIRDKLLAVNRSPKTKPAGLPGPDGGVTV